MIKVFNTKMDMMSSKMEPLEQKIKKECRCKEENIILICNNCHQIRIYADMLIEMIKKKIKDCKEHLPTIENPSNN